MSGVGRGNSKDKNEAKKNYRDNYEKAFGKKDKPKEKYSRPDAYGVRHTITKKDGEIVEYKQEPLGSYPMKEKVWRKDEGTN